jgi:hypothetical protein
MSKDKTQTNELSKPTSDFISEFAASSKPAVTPIGALQLGLVMDEAGSMVHLRQAVLKAVNRLVRSQAQLSPNAEVSISTFSNRVKMIREDISIAAATDLGPGDYRPDGGTALLDGIGTMIDSIAGKVASAPETPIVIAIASDGQENSSQKYKPAQITDMITYRRFTCGWQFLFLSCGEDASKYALSLGISKNCIINFRADPAGVNEALERLSKGISAFRLGDKRALLRLKDKH